MKSPLPFPRARARALLLLAVFGSALAVADAATVWAASSGGRVYNPKALRPKKEPVPTGRTMRRPNPQIKDGQPLKRTYAVIPDPRPQRRGGSKYVRKGRYFYELPRPITVSRRSWTTRNYSAVIPDPTHWSRRVNSRTTK
jgi:hypothetical protein